MVSSNTFRINGFILLPSKKIFAKLILLLEKALKNKIFRDSSMVEQLTVNQLVLGSNPSRGAELEN